MSSHMGRLRWQCRRGMLELDAILQPFFEQHFAALSIEQQNDFEKLLTSTDQDLYSWFIGSSKPSDLALANMVAEILNRLR